MAPTLLFDPDRFYDEVRSRTHGFKEQSMAALAAGCAHRTKGLYETFAPSGEAFPVLERCSQLAWRAASGQALTPDLASAAKGELEALLLGEDDDDWTWKSSLLNNAAIAVMCSIDIALGSDFQCMRWAVSQLLDSAYYILNEASHTPGYVRDPEAWPLFTHALTFLRQDLDALSGDAISTEFLATYQSRVEQETAQMASEATALLGTSRDQQR